MNFRWRITRCSLQYPAMALVLLTAMSSAHACKYSVRDLAFVNIHGTPWRLVAIRPQGSTSDASSEWQGAIDRALEHSNVEHQWISPPSALVDDVTALFPDVAGDSATPRVAVMGPEDRLARVWPPREATDLTFEASVRAVVQSPLRNQILDHLTTSLCVLVVVEGHGANRNDSEATQNAVGIDKLAQAAAERLSRQMWTLDKAPSEGPQVVMVSAQQRAQEHWMLWSLGIDSASHDTSLAVVYGQGRCLGPPLNAEQLTESKLLRWMSICGRDCECDLDRAWLYGQQMLHVWSEDRARAAESSLDFDPRSALVMVEANQILMRNGPANSNTTDLPETSGLVIHDLPELEATTVTAQPIAPQREPDPPNHPAAEMSEVFDTFQGAKLAATALGAIVVLLGIYTLRKRAQ